MSKDIKLNQSLKFEKMKKQMKNIALIGLCIAYLGGCNSQQVDPLEQLKNDIYFLASDDLEGREIGSSGEEKAAGYLAKRFEELGLSQKGTEGFYQPFSVKPSVNPHEQAKVGSDGDSTINGKNVIGFIDNKADRTVIIGAHFDHLGYGDSGSLYRGDSSAIHNGADDNASGTAALLYLAEQLNGKHTSNNYLFIAFSGEEKGLWGSNYFSKNPTIELEEANYMINMDMVGRLKDNKLAINGTGTSPIWEEAFAAVSSDSLEFIKDESGVGPSDHTSFYLQDMPVLHFFTGQHEDYHKPTDDSDKINYEGIQTVAGYILSVIEYLDDKGELAFTKTKDQSSDTPRFTVTLGVVPDYMYNDGGMRIDGVTEDKPAHKAGIEKGDIVIKMGDMEIVDMMGYMEALSSFKAGDSTHVVIKRGEEELEVKVIF